MQVFGSGPRLGEPHGDAARQAVAALRGYAYQIYASSLAWLSLGDGATLYLEVAEDYAVATQTALTGTQVKDTAASGNVTLQSAGIRAAIDSYVDLVARNPDRAVTLHYLTTAEIGAERNKAHRIGKMAGLRYWRRAAAGADVAPLRALIMSLDLEQTTLDHLRKLSDDDFRAEFLQRIHWDCGSPEIAGMRAELEASLIEFATRARRMSSHAAKQAVAAVLERVLLTAVSDKARRLRCADLLELLDDVTSVAVPIEQLQSAFRGADAAGAIVRSSLLAPVEDISLPDRYAPRHALVRELDEARRACGIAIAHGATGLGKSLVARLLAAKSNDSWSIADFRHFPPSEAATRLSHLQGELASSQATHVILDDLNELDDPAVRDALARILTTLRRRDKTAIVTTYRAPADTTLFQFVSDPALPVMVPYLDEDEVAQLVVAMGGATKFAGSVYRAAANGHPQLTRAVLLHLRRKDWSRASLASVLGGQVHAELGAERRAVRQRLVAALTDDAQTLLLRASLIRGAFDHDLAIRVAGIEPAIGRGGLVLDQLVGPWIEPSPGRRLRVSPMLQDAASEVLSIEECREVHHCVADALLRSDSLDAADASMAMHHALGSAQTEFVIAFAHCIIGTNSEIVDALAPFLTELVFLPLDAPIFPQDPAASAMMRLAQMLTLLQNGSPEQARACWEALEQERVHVKGEDLFEGLMLSKLLLHPRTGELFGDWLEILLRFDRLSQTSHLLAAQADFGAKSRDKDHGNGVLFAGQLRSITTIARFREIMERLDQEEPDTRERILSSFQPGRGDIAVLVNHGWLRESQKDGFDWEAAQRDYGVCASLAMRWDNPFLASRCAIAQAMCIDENGGDAERALLCLDDAEDVLGFNIAFSRARAKIHWRKRDHAAALPLLKAAADVGGQDMIERSYIAREAGISAANLGDWPAAADWFERAQAAAAQSSVIPTVRAMAVGLLADTAHAAYNAGRPEVAIVKMRDALKGLTTIDEDGTLAEVHCHRVVRHAVLWLYREITGTKPQGEEDVIYLPGAASNPEPLEAIRSHPVLALDISFYMLADADEELPQPTGLHRDFRDILMGGPVLSCEISAAIKEDHIAIKRHDPENFVDHVRRHASMTRLVTSGEARLLAEELRHPRRGLISRAVIDENAADDILDGAKDYMLSFAIAAAMANRYDAIDSIVEQGLASTEISALHPLLRRMNGDISPPTSDREGAANALWAIRQDLTGRPMEFCWTAMWLLLSVNGSRLPQDVAELLIAWTFAGAEHLVRNARFRLLTPDKTAPPVEEILLSTERTLGSTARLLLKLAPATGANFIPQIHSALEQIAQIIDRGEPSSGSQQPS
ncbi:hypothetical protein [Novosphingopyxis sp.]|uniref:hypothetical protein n=1 Tax=Novosphingopyxis sp. TaxID=2709690 RepID=UPI003B5C977B